MSAFSIEISGEFLEIPAGTVIGYDVAGNDFAELNTRQGVRTNDFNLPATTKNKRLLVSGSRIDAVLYLQNREISRGYVQVVERNFHKRFIKIAYFGSNSDWINLIENKSLRDLSFFELAHEYNLQNVIAGMTSTENYCYPVINYGRFTNRVSSQIDINNQELVPAMFSKAVLFKIFEEAGIKVEGTLLSDILFSKMILPWVGTDEVYPAQTMTFLSLTDNGRFLADVPLFINGILGSNDTVINSGPASYFNAVTGAIVNASAFGGMFFSYSYDITVAGLSTSLEIRRTTYNSSNVVSSSNVIVNTASNGNFTGSETDLFIPPGGRVQFEYLNDNVGTNLDSTLIFTSSTTIMTPEKTLPDVSQRDFVRYVVAAFGVLIRYNEVSKTIFFDLSNQLYANLENAPDWSGKLDVSKGRSQNFIDFIEQYSQENLFSYQEIDGKNIGTGILSVLDNTLPDNQNFYEAPFAATQIIKTGFGCGTIDFPFIEVFEDDADTEIDNETEPRVLNIDIAAGRRTLTISDGTNTQAVTEYNVPTFAPLFFKALLITYYPDIEKIINNKTSFAVYLLLGSSDIANFNQSTVVRINSRDFSGYFYVSIIEDFNGVDKSYKATLLKL